MILHAARHQPDEVRSDAGYARRARHFARVRVAEQVARDEIVAEADVDHAQAVGLHQVGVDVVERLRQHVVEQQSMHLPAFVDAHMAGVADDVVLDRDGVHARIRNDAVRTRPVARVGADDAGHMHAVMRAASAVWKVSGLTPIMLPNLTAGFCVKPPSMMPIFGRTSPGCDLAVLVEDGPHRGHADGLEAPASVVVLAGMPAPRERLAVHDDFRTLGLGHGLGPERRVDESAVDDLFIAQVADERRLENLLQLGFGIRRLAGFRCGGRRADARHGLRIDLDGNDAERRDHLGDDRDCIS